jgi:hypothetical protein
VFFRNYSTHSIVRKLDLGHFPTVLAVSTNFYAVGTADRLLILFTWESVRGDEIVSHVARTTDLAISEDETTIVSAGSTEVAVWNLKSIVR